jgi:hypothetical protein
MEQAREGPKKPDVFDQITGAAGLFATRGETDG